MRWRELVLGVGCLAALPATAVAEETPVERATARIVRALNDWRIGQGLAEFTPTEALAIVAREQAAALAALKWDGGDWPDGFGPIADRAKELHHLEGITVADYLLVDPAALDLPAIVAALRDGRMVSWLPSDNVHVVAIGTAPLGNRWVLTVALRQWVPKGLPELQEKVRAAAAPLAGDDPAARAAACAPLGALCNVEALPPLRRALRDPAPEVRAAAATAMGQIGSRGSVPPLLDAAADADPAVRAAALAALRALTQADHGADAAAWRTWWGSPEGRAMVGAAEVVDPTKVPIPVRPLATILEELGAAGGALGSNRRVDLLRELRHHPERTDSAVAAAGLQALRDRSSSTRMEGARLVAALRLKSAVPALCKLATPDRGGNVDVARIALLALAQIGDVRALDAFTAPIRDWMTQGQLHSTRVEAVRYLRHARAVEWLMRQFTSGSITVDGGDYQDPVGVSLEHLTGEQFGNDQSAWRKWWKRAKSGFRPAPLPDDYVVPGLYDEG